MTNTLKSTRRPLLSAALTAVLAFACVSAASAAERETRTLTGSVHSIRLEGPLDLALSQGKTEGVEIEGEAAVRARVKVSLNDGELTLHYDGDGCRVLCSQGDKSSVRARLALPELRQLSLKGSGDARLDTFDLGDAELRIEIFGSGDVRADKLTAGALAAAIRGSGDIQVAGRAKAQSVSIAGSGDYDGSGLRSEAGSVSIKGSGDASVWAVETLAVDIAGSGDVVYTGEPRISQQILGSGSVTRR